MRLFFLLNGETADSDTDRAWAIDEFRWARIDVTTLAPGDAHTLTLERTDEDGDVVVDTLSVYAE